jgi:hypothetical protein
MTLTSRRWRGGCLLETCELLKLNPDDLTAAQKIRVDRASALRLQIDDLQSAQLRGAQIDLGKLIEASEALEHLLATSVTIPVKEHTEAREALGTSSISRMSPAGARLPVCSHAMKRGA